MNGIPEAGMLAQRLLITRMATFDYYPVRHTPGLWTHRTHPIWFTLVVDDATKPQ